VTLELGTGTCRDYAVLFIALARTLGVAARFVSGYLFDPHQLGDSPGDMHAWVEVFIPGAGWRALDPTHGIFCDNAYVPVAHAVLAESVNPVQGSFFGPTVEAQLTTHVRVRRSDAGLG
jgi:transglutaminase-like putative cysteine protease